MKKQTRYQLAAVLLLACLFAQTMGHACNASITFDEGPHLAIGYATLRTGDLRVQPVHIHPPLANVMAAVPLLLQTDLPDPRTIGGWDIASLSAISDAIVWQYPYPRRMAAASRFPIIMMTLLLGAVVFRWASDLFGPRAGLVALGLYAFDPNVIAHGSLVTTDMAVVLWGTSALFLTTRYLRSSRWKYGAGIGIILGLAMASKVSAISLLPPVGLLFLMGPRSLPWRRRILAVVGCIGLAALTLWAAYGFEFRPIPGFPLPLPAATHLEIYLSLQEHYQLGHPSFLMGQNSEHGWWYYFPVAFVLKTPLPTLLLMIVTGLQVCKSAIHHLDIPGGLHRSRDFHIAPPCEVWKPRLHPPTLLERYSAGWQRIALRWGPLVLYPILYAASSLLSSVNIGYRHMLPLLPFLFILISQIANHALRVTRHVLRITFYALLIYYLTSTLRLFPHYLPYFNLLAGGPAGGYRYLVDSNLDWGQNMWQLRDWMAENDVEKVSYAHFSPDRPQVYGIQADFLPPDPRAVPFAPFDPAPGVYAIGATVLQGAYAPDVNTYAWFRSHEPVARLGHALFVYDVPPRPSPAWIAVCADLAPLLSSEAVRTKFGNPNMRVIWPNCEQSWVYHADGEPGGYVLSPGTEIPPSATLEAAARQPDGNPLYDVYRVSQGPVPGHLTEGVMLDGPLTFLGYQADTSTVQPDDTVELWTFWKVDEIPDRPLSLMAHLLGPDGVPVAVGDGLGLSVDQWQPGDVIVQRHRLLVPEETLAGEYQLQTGAYWLDSLDRWQAHLNDGTSSDRILLNKIEVNKP
ncbi:MAG: glycosyltransferase family 39 protein [Chloroflexi bacterium]|nr:glycosyltransferase family 39 protein [Chloroflexota bacterium]